MSASVDSVRSLLPDERAALVAALHGWAFDEDRNAIRKSYRFANFIEAFAFMSRVALLAEKFDHHPEWSNTYNVVDILLTTHDADGVSMRDIDLARAIDRSGPIDTPPTPDQS